MTRRVLLAVDVLDHRTADVLERACRFVSDLGETSLKVVSVVDNKHLDTLTQQRPPDKQYADLVLQDLQRDLEQQLHSTGSAMDAATTTQVIKGDPSEEIIRMADREHVDYVVIGVRKRSRVGKLLLGSTSQSVLLGASCPIVAVPA